MSKQERVELISTIILGLVDRKEITLWMDIMEAVRDEVDVKDWSEVRGVLQFHLDNGDVKRTDYLKNEEYIKG